MKLNFSQPFPKKCYATISLSHAKSPLDLKVCILKHLQPKTQQFVNKKKYVKQSINSFLHRNCLWINYPNCWNKGDTWYSYLSAFGNYWRITFAQFLEIFLWLCIVLHKPSILQTSVLENKIALRNGVGWDFE